jgi:hypothetical protein
MPEKNFLKKILPVAEFDFRKAVLIDHSSHHDQRFRQADHNNAPLVSARGREDEKTKKIAWERILAPP